PPWCCWRSRAPGGWWPTPRGPSAPGPGGPGPGPGWRCPPARSLDAVAVVAEEQLFERGRRALQRADPGLAEPADDVVEVGGVDVEGHRVAVGLEAVHAGVLGQPGGDPVGLGPHGRAGQLAERGERARLHRAAGSDDGDPVA